MCYAAPGPRCASHTRPAYLVAEKQLEGSQASLDASPDLNKLIVHKTVVADYRTAAEDFALSPAGRQYLTDRADADHKAGRGKEAETLRELIREGKARQGRMLDAFYEEHIAPVPQAAASSPKTATPMLARLAEHKDPTVRRLVASNPSIPTKVLSDLGHRFPHSVALNGNASANTLTRIASDPHLRLTGAQFAALRHPNLPASVRDEALACFRNPDGTYTATAASAILEDDETPEKTLAALSSQGWAVASHRNTGVKLGTFLASLPPDATRGSRDTQRVTAWDEHQALLRRHDLAPEVLVQLTHTYSGYGDKEERESTFDQIVSHPNCPARTVERLRPASVA